MGKKILYIVLGALVVFGLLFLMWSWFFSGPSANPNTTGTLGSAGDVTQTPGAGNNSSNNGQAPIGSNTNTNGTQVIGGGNGGQDIGAGGVNTNTAGTSGGTGATLGGTTDIPGVNWLPSDTTLSGGTTGSGFNPISINGVANGYVGGTVPTIGGGVSSGTSGSNSNLAFLGAGIAGAVSCGIRAAGLSGAIGLGVSSAGGVATVGVPVGGPALGIIAGNASAQTSLQNGDQATSFAACILNTVAKAALAQITASVVNWINSGFNGSPSFVTNYQQFFTNVADSAAGQFIQGSGLAFLCSPFQLQIKIAIAQSYANRNAQSCTLTKVIGNINSFMNGNFSQGGWGGFVSFTTVPTNNPYGAYAYGQIGLATAQQNALANAKNNISPTGFLNLQQIYNCDDAKYNGIGGGASIGTNAQAATAAGSAALPSGCKTKVVTPGGVIADSLGAVNKSGVDQLGLGNSLDQIMNALINQLMVRSLQSGLSNLSGVSGYESNFQTPEELAAQQQAQAMLGDMQNEVALEQQLGAIDQGSIGDIQAAQAPLNDLLNCWNSAAASPSNSQAAQASANASSTQALLDTLTARAALFNNSITQINNAIANLQEFQSQALTVASATDVANLQASYNAAKASGVFVSAADITTAQQNRTSLQADMASLNTQTQNNLAQCNAMQ